MIPENHKPDLHSVSLYLLLLVGFTSGVLGQDLSHYSSIKDIRALDAEALNEGHSVSLEGVVVGRNQGARRLLIQKDGAGLGMVSPRNLELPQVGARISVTGRTIHTVGARVAFDKLTIVTPSDTMPDPVILSVAEAMDRTNNAGQLVRVSAFVQGIRPGLHDTGTLLDNRIRVQLRESNQVLTALILRQSNTFKINPRLGELTVEGVLTDVTLPGSAPLRCLRVLDPNSVSLDREGPADPFAKPSPQIAPFLAGEIYTNREPLKLRGRVRETLNDDQFTLQFTDNSEDTILCRNAPDPMATNMVVELLGYPMSTDEGARIDIAQVRQLALPAAHTPEDDRSMPLADYVPIITNITRLQNLDANDTKQGLPFEIRGVVTYHDVVHPFFYVQHYTGKGVRVLWTESGDLPVYNEQVTVFGHATNGVRIPYLVGRKLETRGKADKPVPTRWIGGSGFRTGDETGRRMKLNAVVRSVRSAGDEDVAVVKFGREGEVFGARVQLHGQALPTHWVDARIMVQGVSAAWQPSPDVFLEQVFLVQHPEDIIVHIEAPKDPYAADPRSVSAILKQPWTDRFIHRVRVNGVVTYASRQKIFVDDDSGGIEVRPREALSINVGDQVRVAGFPTKGRIVPFLEEAMVRRISAGELPSAKSIRVAEVLGSDVNGRRVRIKGKVLGHPQFPENQMELRDAGQTFTALIPDRLPAPAPDIWPIGAVIEVTGICQYHGGGEGGPDGFQIRLNDAASVTILSPPSWWTPERTRLTAIGLILLAMGAVGWAAFFRNRARQSRLQFLTTFHANPMPAWIIRQADGTCLEMNGEFERMFALARKDVIGHELIHLWSSEKEGRAFVERLRTHPSVRAEEAHLQSHDGKDRNVLLSTESIVIDGENCVLLIAYDVTERLRLLEQLRQSQKMEAIGQLAAGIAHDFNNLMTVVRGNAGLLSTDESLSKDARMLTDEIEDASHRAAELTSQMLAFSRKSIMRLRIVDLRDILRTAAGMLNRMIGETIEVSYHCPREPLLVKADPVMLDQVLLNLGVNARDAMPEGGMLKMSARLVEYDGDNLPPQAEAQPGRYVLVEVEDTGAGMSEDVKQHIFDPFFTTKDIGHGTGLGLSTAYGILRQHGGWIAVESQLDQGSKFTLHLPATAKPTEESDREIPSDEFGHGTETILMVDDEDRVRQTVSRTLKHYGYRVLEAVDGPTAEKLWSEQRDEVGLVLTDLVIPNGCSGLELGRRLQAEKPDLKIIYMTGQSQELLEHGGQLVAGVNFLPKPFENRDLVRLIRERLDGSNTVASDADRALKSLA